VGYGHMPRGQKQGRGIHAMDPPLGGAAVLSQGAMPHIYRNRNRPGYSTIVRFLYELVASFHACQHCSPWPSWRPRAVAAWGAVRKIRGTPRQRGGGKAHEHGMLCSYTPRCTSCLGMCFLLTFQEVRPMSKTRNQLHRKEQDRLAVHSMRVSASTR
jgi:hypothetical protein